MILFVHLIPEQLSPIRLLLLLVHQVKCYPIMALDVLSLLKLLKGSQSTGLSLMLRNEGS